MKKSEYVEIVFTSINGGRPNTDLSVMREDIAALLPAAVNYAKTGDYWANIQRDNDREIPCSFITEEEVSGFGMDAVGRAVAPFDRKIIPMPGNVGVRYVQDELGNIYSPKPLGVAYKSYWDKATEYNTEYQIRNKCLYLFGKPELVDTVLVGYMMDVSCLEDDDELPVPAGMEPQVIDLLTSFFTNQRMKPKDYIIDGVDPVNAQQ